VPSSAPTSDPVQQLLTALRNGLLHHHKILLDSERDSYEHEIGKIGSANQLLQLVIHDPWFAWLHELSELIVYIDETQEAEEPISAADADKLVQQARTLLIPAEEGTEFARRYDQAMQRDPDVIIAHGRIVKLLAKLREGGAADLQS
jgi:hypothetical protein